MVKVTIETDDTKKVITGDIVVGLACTYKENTSNNNAFCVGESTLEQLSTCTANLAGKLLSSQCDDSLTREIVRKQFLEVFDSKFNGVESQKTSVEELLDSIFEIAGINKEDKNGREND